MTNEVKWLVPQRVLYFNMEGEISRTEFVRINELVARFIREGQAPIHLIADISALKWLSANVAWIAKTTAIRDKKVDYVSVVGASGFFVFTTEIVKALTKSKIQSFDSVDTAYQVLYTNDASLPPQIPKTND